MEYRIEHDSMGEMKVPADRRWAAQTQRSRENFEIGVGIENVCLSTLNLVGRDGIRRKVNLPLSDSEIMKLRHSADVLKQTINSLNI